MSMTETIVPEEQRWIDLDGADNVRDLGGLPVTDGERIRFRRLLRSGTLQDLTAGDVTHLVNFVGVRTVVDLRLSDEAGERRAVCAQLHGPAA